MDLILFRTSIQACDPHSILRTSPNGRVGYMRLRGGLDAWLRRTIPGSRNVGVTMIDVAKVIKIG